MGLGTSCCQKEILPIGLFYVGFDHVKLPMFVCFIYEVGSFMWLNPIIMENQIHGKPLAW